MDFVLLLLLYYLNWFCFLCNYIIDCKLYFYHYVLLTVNYGSKKAFSHLFWFMLWSKYVHYKYISISLFICYWNIKSPLCFLELYELYEFGICDLLFCWHNKVSFYLQCKGIKDILLDETISSWRNLIMNVYVKQRTYLNKCTYAIFRTSARSFIKIISEKVTRNKSCVYVLYLYTIL